MVAARFSITAEVSLKPSEHPLLSAIAWIAERALKPAVEQEIRERRKLKVLTMIGRPCLWVTVSDFNADLVREIHGSPPAWREVDEIGGEIKIGGGGDNREFEFTARLQEISTPKRRFSYDGVVVEIRESKQILPPKGYKPILRPRRYFIRGINAAEFKLVRTEKMGGKGSR